MTAEAAIPFLELKLIDGLVGDRGRDQGAADIDTHVRRRLPFITSAICP